MVGSSRRMAGALAGTTAGYSVGAGSMAGHGGRGGVIGESVLLLRELERGNYARVPGSLTILVQRMGMLKYLVKDNAAVALEHAAALEVEAIAARETATAAELKATASTAASVATKTGAETSLSTAVYYEAELIAANANAAAMEQKSASSLALVGTQNMASAATLEQAEADEVAAMAARQNAITARFKSDVAWGCFEAEYADAEATAIAAAANDAEAMAANQAAIALQKEAIAAREVAAAQKMSISTLGIVVLALVAVGVAVYYLVKHFRILAQAEKNAAEISDHTTHLFSEREKHLKSAAEMTQAYIDLLKEQASSEKGAKDEMESALKVMRERAKLEQELAKAHGAGKAQIAQMELAADRAELELMKNTSKELATKIKLAQEAQGLAAMKAAYFQGGMGKDSAASMESARKNSGQWALVIDQIREQMKKSVVDYSAGGGMDTGMGEFDVRPANETDVFDVKVGEKKYRESLQSAMQKHDAEAAEAQRLERMQKELTDLLKKKETLTNEEISRATKLKSEISESEAMLGIKQEFLPKIAAAEAGKSGIGKSGDSLVRVGNFLGSAKGQIETLALEQVHLARKLLAVSMATEKNTRKPGNNPGSSHYPIT